MKSLIEEKKNLEKKLAEVNKRMENMKHDYELSIQYITAKSLEGLTGSNIHERINVFDEDLAWCVEGTPEVFDDLLSAQERIWGMVEEDPYEFGIYYSARRNKYVLTWYEIAERWYEEDDEESAELEIVETNLINFLNE